MFIDLYFSFSFLSTLSKKTRCECEKSTDAEL